MSTSPWSSIVSCKLRSLITWLVSYHHTFGGCPHPCILSKDNFKTYPEVLHFQWHKKGINLATVTFNRVSGSQSISQRYSSYKVLAYPSFSGHAKDWIAFERDFRAIATAQGFGYILQHEPNLSTTAYGKSNYALDSAFIYNVLKNCWSDSTSSYIVKKHASSKDGRQLYLDAKLHFRVTETAAPCPLPSSYDRQQEIKLRIAQLRLVKKNSLTLLFMAHLQQLPMPTLNCHLSHSLVLWRHSMLILLVLTFLLMMTICCSPSMLLVPSWFHLRCTNCCPFQILPRQGSALSCLQALHRPLS